MGDASWTPSGKDTPSNRMDVMDEVLEILRDDRVKELIEKTARYYYTSTAVNVDLTIPGIVVGLFLLVLAVTGGWYAETFGSVLKNLLTFLLLLLLPPYCLTPTLRGSPLPPGTIWRILCRRGQAPHKTTLELRRKVTETRKLRCPKWFPKRRQIV